MNTYFNRKIKRSTFNGICETLIHEGYFTTYSVDKLKNTLLKKFGDRFTFEGEDVLGGIGGSSTKYGIIYSINGFLADATKEEVVYIERVLALFGYYISQVDLSDKGVYSFSIEPKNALDITSALKILDVKWMYHITHQSNLDKIEKFGLAPRGTETTFYHPDDRIYLLWSPEKHIIDAFKHVLAKNKQIDVEEFSVLKIPFNIKYRYFLDDTGTNLGLSYIACFVLQNIPPQEIHFS